MDETLYTIVTLFLRVFGTLVVHPSLNFMKNECFFYLHLPLCLNIFKALYMNFCLYHPYHLCEREVCPLRKSLLDCLEYMGEFLFFITKIK